MQESKARSYFRVDEFAKEAGVHPATVSDEIQAGRIGVERGGSHGQFMSIPSDELPKFKARRDAERQSHTANTDRQRIAAKYNDQVAQGGDQRAKDAARIAELHKEAMEILARHGKTH